MGMPEGDPEKGKKIFMQRCAHCHTIEAGGKQLHSPNLHGIVGRRSGSSPGYNNYTEANKNINVVWTKQNLFEYLANPRKYIPGTKAVKLFGSVKNEVDRADVIAYLEKQK